MTYSKVLRTAIMALAIASGCAAHISPREQALEKELASLREEADILSDSNAELSVENITCADDLTDLQKKNEILEMRIATLVEYQEEITAELKESDIATHSLSKEYETAQADLAAKQKLIDEMQRKQEAAKARVQDVRRMLDSFKGLIKGGKLKLAVRSGRIVLELPSEVIFDSGRAQVNDDGLVTLREVAVVLMGMEGRKFQVAGHTDDRPISRKRFPSNWHLSAARAIAVVQVLKEQGVNPAVLSAAGYGEFTPVAANDTEKGRATNRRIEIVMVPNLEDLPDLSSIEKELN